jgi:Tfp pilus assembly protein PilN
MILLMLVSVAAGVLTWFPAMAEKQYRRVILAEIESVRPKASESDDLDRRITALRSRVQAIDKFRMRTKDDMDGLAELTQIIAPPTWLHSMALTRRTLSLTGAAEQAAKLLKVIDGSSQFSSSEFCAPVAPEGRFEAFCIRSKRKEVSHETHWSRP